MQRDICFDISAWLVSATLDGVAEQEILRGFCERLGGAGIPLAEANLLIDTLHPIYEGRVFRWRRGESELLPVVEYGRTGDGGENDERWRTSPFFRLLETGETMLRRGLEAGAGQEFPVHRDFAERGMSEYLAFVHRFGAEGTIGEMDCIYSSWITDRPGGFSEEQVSMMSELGPSLAAALKSASQTRITRTLVETYLGRDTGRRVLAGKIARGVTEKISAVLWFSDLRGFTRTTETCDPDAIIPFLNDYSDAVITAIHGAGGEVLKLIGDGTLAIFDARDPASGCARALAAYATLKETVPGLSEERRKVRLPVTSPYVGLHIGEVFYGNVGSEERLDFTVVGPAVNETSRIAAMCRSAERDVLVSTAFRAAASPREQAGLVSVGRYALRGVARPQELFTIDAQADRAAAS
ncbi:adenylate/guanylate cyclase domain-containing protein [Amorphus orientalis]|uniref:Adenylate cyclase n=1 Tax=Amorphus orientalis TaxID=649198 RepID=A0AAE4AT50_9HYPH|nr:adenylate/guanylate cyclase domain-containing protein [Amorphus orientalis]MDQ0315735.1 adenylate cyclase [Amorphus orientalis]